MAKEFIVVKDGKDIVDRVDSKAEAEASALAFLSESPNASFEFGKLDKRIFTFRNNVSYDYQEETY